MSLVSPAFAARVALIVADEDLENVLTARLSQQSGVELVERSALSSLARESALTGNLSHLAGAEIVAIGEKHPGGGFAVRLADPASGATLQTFLTPAGLDASLTADWLALRLAPWLSKSPAAASRRFSLIGFRFDVDSEAHRQMERSLNLAVAAALQASPDAVVLERWKLNDLVFEKELAGRGDEPFWSAAQLLDGSLSENNGHLHARMRMRTGGQESIVEAESSVDDLPGLAAQLTALALHTGVAPNPSREAEAAAYINEATWLLKHGLKKEAAQAAETAIALGDQKQTTETLRLRAYAEAAYPEDLSPNLRQGADSAYERSDLPPERVAESVALATTVATLSEAYARKHAAMSRGINVTYEHPTVICVRTLPFVLSVLRSAHKCGYDRTHPEAIQTLRAGIKRLMAAVEALPLLDKRAWLDASGAYFRHLIVFAPYWNDTPEETLRFMDKVLAPDFDKECRDGCFVARRVIAPDGFFPPAIHLPMTKDRPWTNAPLVGPPRLINWHDLDDTRLDSLWRKYVENKLASPDALTQADGLALLWTSQATYGERNAISPKYVDFLEKYSDELYGAWGRAIWQQIRVPVGEECSWIGQNENRLRTLAVFEKLLNGSQPLAPGVVGSMSFCVPDEAKRLDRVKEEEGQRLLGALANYSDHFGAAVPENAEREIRSTRNSILRTFPDLAPKPPSDALPVTRAWIVSGHTPENLRGKGYFDSDFGVWYDGFLWFLDGVDRKIWKVDPVTFDTEVLAPDNRPAAAPAKSFTRGNNLRHLYKRPVFAAGKLYLAEQENVWIYRIAGDTWAPLALPRARYTLWMVGKRLFASFGDQREDGDASAEKGTGVYEINPVDDSARLIFNSRRRPPEHPLDGIAQQQAFCLLPSRQGGVVVALPDPFGFRDLESGKEVIQVNRNLFSNVVSRPEGTLFCHTVYQKNQNLRGIQLWNTRGDLETLIWNPASDIPQPSQPVWKFPASIPDPATTPSRIEYRAALRGDDLLLLVYQYGNTPWGAGLADLYLFRRGQSEATRIPLAFRLSPAADAELKQYHHSSTSFAYPMIDHYGLIPTDQGLALAGLAMPGFWFIPWSDIDAREKAAH